MKNGHCQEYRTFAVLGRKANPRRSKTIGRESGAGTKEC